MAISTIGANSLAQSRILTAVQQPAGAVLQVVQATTNTQSSVSSTSLVTTGISASITPTSSTSKILVRFITSVYTAANGRGTAFAIYRGASQIWYPGNANSSGGFGSFYVANGNDCAAMIPIEYLDSPATTSSTTYTLYAATVNGLVYFNLTGTPNSGQTSVILMEIAG